MAESELSVQMADKIFKRYGESMNAAELPEEHRTVALVVAANGLLCNGGFQYLFENDIPGDPEYLLMRQAHKTIGATEASAAFAKAFALFPKSAPPNDISRRLEIWRARYSWMDGFEDKQSPDYVYLHAEKETLPIARYVYREQPGRVSTR